MRIVFWGTSSFAVPALRALLGEGFDVVGVVTQPDRAVGRSRSTLVPSPVKSAAVDEELPVFQPESPADEQFLVELRALEPELSIVVSYGHILKSSLIALPDARHRSTCTRRCFPHCAELRRSRGQFARGWPRRASR